jgi:tRNA pseudouridine32 synthase/23S rRNA pseudouridine746 synthase
VVKSLLNPHRSEPQGATSAPKPPPVPPPIQGEALCVHHVDQHLLVCDKPAGLLAVPGRGEAGRDCLLARLQPRWPDLEVVHRLDMATSGLIVFARGKAAQRALGIAFAARRVSKRYVAVVQGEVAPAEGWREIDLPLIADWPRRPRQKVDFASGKPSLTRYRVLQSQGSTTRLALEPVTGRSHQLRVHLMAIGHPILGDALYAPQAVAAAAPRLLLHAAALAFDHPAGGRLQFESAVPF